MMSEPTGVSADSGSVRVAAANAVAPDPVTADLLAKHSAGERLSQSEYGKLGAFKAKLKSVFGGGKSDAPGQPPLARPGNGPGVAAVAPAQAPADGLAAVPVDADIAKRTTAALLKRVDAVTVRWIEGHARRAGAEGDTLVRFRAAASLPQADRELITELAPDALAEIGVDPRKYPLVIVCGVLGLHATNLWLVVDELKGLRAKQDSARAEALREKHGTSPQFPRLRTADPPNKIDPGAS